MVEYSVASRGKVMVELMVSWKVALKVGWTEQRRVVSTAARKVGQLVAPRVVDSAVVKDILMVEVLAGMLAYQ